MSINLVFSEEIREARETGQPIVALESTIITHGMPYPQNVEVAQDVENVVRQNGATPATIAILDGSLHIGLSKDQLEGLGQANKVAKVSRADIAAIIAKGKTGATTVSATMIAANLADIKVFATGGIGGVHRGAEQSFDVSADLQELSQTPVSVVCAGAKAILDLPKTFEVLETLGVPVVAYGQDALPAFWSSTSELNAPLRADNPHQIADMIRVRREMGIPGGCLIANPIPKDAEIPNEVITPIIEAALKAAAVQGVHGKDVTPFLLQKIFEITKGASLTANIALIKNNAALASQVAKSLCD